MSSKQHDLKIASMIKKIVCNLEKDITDKEEFADNLYEYNKKEINMSRLRFGLILGAVLTKIQKDHETNSNSSTRTASKQFRHFLIETADDIENALTQRVNEKIFKYVRCVKEGEYYVYVGKDKKYTAKKMSTLLNCDKVQVLEKEIEHDDSSLFRYGIPCGKKNASIKNNDI